MNPFKLNFMTASCGPVVERLSFYPKVNEPDDGYDDQNLVT